MLTIARDAKTVKGQKYGYLTGILYLAPHKTSGRNLCPDASPGCVATCLNTAGRGVMAPVQAGRLRKTLALRSDRQAFLAEVVADIHKLTRKAEREGYTPLVRLNGTSDIPWENVLVETGNAPGESKAQRSLMAMFPSVQFYDYTKSVRRMEWFLGGRLPRNYHLTFSRSECNEVAALQILRLGGNVAVVFSTVKGQALPTSWHGYAVVDGDISDARPGDTPGAYNPANGASSIARRGVVVGLRAKGKARKDTSGFVVKVGG